jgi:DNA-binding NarL/FixJ family response regulator
MAPDPTGARTIALSDDAAFRRETFSFYLEQHLIGYRVMQYTDAREVADDLRSAGTDRADLVLLNVSDLSEAEIRECLDLARTAADGAPIGLLLSSAEQATRMPWLQDCVDGLLLMNERPPVAVAAVHLMASGGCYLPAPLARSPDPQSAARRAESYAPPPEGPPAARAREPAPASPEVRSDPNEVGSGPDLGRHQTGPQKHEFSERQMQVAHLLLRGLPNKLIAHELGMRESTVKVHVGQVMKKLGATNRTQAAYIASQLLGRQADGPHPGDPSNTGGTDGEGRGGGPH